MDIVFAELMRNLGNIHYEKTKDNLKKILNKISFQLGPFLLYEIIQVYLYEVQRTKNKVKSASVPPKPVENYNRKSEEIRTRKEEERKGEGLEVLDKEKKKEVEGKIQKGQESGEKKEQVGKLKGNRGENIGKSNGEVKGGGVEGRGEGNGREGGGGKKAEGLGKENGSKKEEGFGGKRVSGRKIEKGGKSEENGGRRNEGGERGNGFGSTD